MNTCVKLLLVTATILSVHLNGYGAPPTLQQYIANHPELQVTGTVVACAAGGKAVAMGDNAHPISIYFYPIPGATNFHYFEADLANIDSHDRSRYVEKSLPVAPVFNGYLRRFKRGPVSHEVWGIVSYEAGGRLLLSNPIHIKLASQPTQMANELVDIQTNGTKPVFQWKDGEFKPNAVYFEVVSDSANNLISGTYTVEKRWLFYDLSNVVFNIHDVHPAPALKPETNYTFTLMAVSKDNWVNLMTRKSFTTGN